MPDPIKEDPRKDEEVVDETPVEGEEPKEKDS